jgi:DNA-binding CsgD family transcriptional regulator
VRPVDNGVVADGVGTAELIVGREVERARVAAFLAAPGWARSLTLVGDPGIGKTTVWEAGVAEGRANGLRVLITRATEPELQLSYVALADLLDEVDTAAVDGLPAPQRQALEVAILRAEPGPHPPEPLAVAAGLTRVLRRLSDAGPLVVAIDDVPWLDRSSQDALAFAARRLRGQAVRFLLTRRPVEPPPLESAFGPAGVERLEIGALSLGAVRSLLAERLDLRPPRRVLLRLFELSHGSPLVALELGRMLVDRGLPDLGDELPLPELVDEVFGRRIAGLSGPVRRALLAVALSGELGRLELTTVVGPLALEDAIVAGVLVPAGSRVRASHPLVAAAARRLTSAEERREVHLDLAEAIGDETLQARHLALAAPRPDAALAKRVVAAAAKAIGRGAVHDGAELAEQALRLTPPGAPEYQERLMQLVRYLKIAGEQSRVRELLEARLADLPPGPARARVLLTLSDSGERLSELEAYVDGALAECGDDAELRSTALATKALINAIVRFERLDQAEDWAREAHRLAQAGSPDAKQRALHALAWVNVMRGRPLDELGAPSGAAPEGTSLYEGAIERPAGIRLMVRGNVDESRAVFERLRALAGERGEAVSASIMHRQLCEIELRAGDVHAARRHLEEWGEWTLPDDEHDQIVGPARCRALLEAIAGHPDDAVAWAAKAIEAAGAIENYREETEARRAAGLAALFSHDHGRALEELRPLWRHAEREAIDDPGVIPVAPDLVEALVGSGEAGEARAVTERLDRLADRQQHPWGLASAKRCRALIDDATGADSETAEEELAQAAADYEQLGLHFDAARSLLILGRLQRRHRKWAAARKALEQAAAVFDEHGSDGWASRARSELSRIGGRRPAAHGALTWTEARVAELAAGGYSNKEIAAALVVSVYTVERHLKHAYAKLGIRSRSQLAGRIGPAEAS